MNELLIKLKNAKTPNEEAIQQTETLQKTIIQKLRPNTGIPTLDQTTDSSASSTSYTPNDDVELQGARKTNFC